MSCADGSRHSWRESRQLTQDILQKNFKKKSMSTRDEEGGEPGNKFTCGAFEVLQNYL